MPVEDEEKGGSGSEVRKDAKTGRQSSSSFSNTYSSCSSCSS